MIVLEDVESEACLFQVAHALNPFGAAFGLIKGGQQQCRQNPDNGNDNEQLHQGECLDPGSGTSGSHAKNSFKQEQCRELLTSQNSTNRLSVREGHAKSVKNTQAPLKLWPCEVRHLQ